jgi:SHS2 domain-containing protein
MEDIKIKEIETTVPEKKYEYLDHTADVQLHSWGETLQESFEQIAMSMFGYMTEIDKVEMKDEKDVEILLDAEDDILNLVFKWLDEWLFIFSAEPFFIARKIVIKEFDADRGYIKAVGYGETFDIKKHPQGTEVKAITYSNMQVHKDKQTNDIYVMIDI